MKISLVVAMSRNRVIGAANRLPWRLPEDLKRFRAITTGHPIIMGRKTFESIGKPLPERENIVLTRTPGLALAGATMLGSLDQALEHCRARTDEAMVIGGAEIFKLALPRAGRIYLTVIDRDFEGDAFLPDWPAADFREVSREERPESAGNPMGFRFLVLDRA